MKEIILSSSRNQIRARYYSFTGVQHSCESASHGTWSRHAPKPKLLDERCKYQKGVANSGSRKGVLEMAETCCKALPALMAPSILAVSSCLTGRLHRNPAARESTSSEERNKPKSVSEMRQSRAAQLGRDHLALVGNSTRGHLFLAKYRDMLLIKEGVIRIITSVQFDETRKKWTVRAACAKCTNTTVESTKWIPQHRMRYLSRG
jgi:hypothetical protein